MAMESREIKARCQEERGFGSLSSSGRLEPRAGFSELRSKLRKKVKAEQRLPAHEDAEGRAGRGVGGGMASEMLVSRGTRPGLNFARRNLCV